MAACQSTRRSFMNGAAVLLAAAPTLPALAAPASDLEVPRAVAAYKAVLAECHAAQEAIEAIDARRPSDQFGPVELESVPFDGVVNGTEAYADWAKRCTEASRRDTAKRVQREPGRNLTTAAPDLLAALKRLLEHVERHNCLYERGEDAEVRDMVLAAIAKAEECSSETRQ